MAVGCTKHLLQTRRMANAVPFGCGTSLRQFVPPGLTGAAAAVLYRTFNYRNIL